ncbi:MAG: hypothetical protein GXY74_15890 [Phycisphaerae bacterium]|nr:hypothetical protein [Phycisphaerae bacterium]
MKRVCMLLWREWRENRWFLYAGLLLLLIIPAVGLRPVPLSSPDPYAASNHMVGVRQIADITCAFAVILGGLLAVVVGVAAGCRDMRGRVSDFWRSRPVTLGSWLSARYLAGLATVLVATSVPLLAVWVLLLVAEPIMNYSGGYACANGILAYVVPHAALLALIYSLAMLLGVLVRRPSHAAILAIAAALMVYFLPILVPPLGTLNFWNFIENPRDTPVAVLPVRETAKAVLDRFRGLTFRGWFLGASDDGLAFMAAAAGLSAATLAAMVLSARRQWRVRMNQKLIVWSLGGVTLLLFATMAFQLRSNLDAQLRTPVQPPGAEARRRVVDIHASASRGVLVLCDNEVMPFQNTVFYTAAAFEISGDQLKLGPEIPLGEEEPWYQGGRAAGTVAWSARRPDRLYQLLRRYEKVEHIDANGRKWSAGGKCLEMSLRTLALDSNPPGRVVHTLDLMPHDDGFHCFTPLVLMGDRLYVRGPLIKGDHLRSVRCLVIDLADANRPQRIATVDMAPDAWPDWYDLGPSLTIPLPELPDLSPQERFAVMIALRGKTDHPDAWDGNLMASISGDRASVATHRVTFEGNAVHIALLGERRSTPLESRVGRFGDCSAIRGRYFYATTHSLSTGVTVFDVSDPTRPRRAAFYAAGPDWSMPMVVLDDGRILLGGNELHVIKPVPGG